MGKESDTKKKSDLLSDLKKQIKRRKMKKGEREISAIIESFREELTTVKGHDDNIPSPSPRLHATLISNPLSNNELLLFGGEYYDGNTCHFYADFVKYCIQEGQWKSLPYGPPPRSSHQCVATSQGQIYLFGGECASSKESQYYHYKDFWCFDLRTLQWEELQSGPPPRSGHRMVLWKHYLVLYGGFFDNHSELRYYDDVWIYDLKPDGKWIKSVPSINNIHAPSPRSGFVFLSVEEGIFMYGGYVKSLVSAKGIAKGNILNDVFMLKIDTELHHHWEPIKISGVTDSCPRSGVTGLVHKMNKIYLFGGLFDSQDLEDESTSHSECFQDLRLIQLCGKKSCTTTITVTGDINPESLYINSLSVSNDLITHPTVKLNTIHPRCHAMMAIQSNQMFIYGGKYEKQDREYTLDDLYQLNLDKMDGFLCLQQSTIQDHIWIEDQDDDSNDSDCCSDSSTDDFDMIKIDDNLINNGESLRDFFERTQQFWISQVSFNNEPIDTKSIRTKAFMLAKNHYESTIK